MLLLSVSVSTHHPLLEGAGHPSAACRRAAAGSCWLQVAAGQLLEGASGVGEAALGVAAGGAAAGVGAAGVVVPEVEAPSPPLLLL